MKLLLAGGKGTTVHDNSSQFSFVKIDDRHKNSRK